MYFTQINCKNQQYLALKHSFPGDSTYLSYVGGAILNGIRWEMWVLFGTKVIMRYYVNLKHIWQWKADAVFFYEFFLLYRMALPQICVLVFFIFRVMESPYSAYYAKYMNCLHILQHILCEANKLSRVWRYVY